MLIRMLVQMSGGRYDHREWVPYGHTMEVPDSEGEELIAIGNAEPAENEELKRGWEVLRVPDHNFEDRLREGYDEDGEDDDEDLSRDEPEEDDFDSDFDRDEEDKEVIELKKPYENAKKDIWIDYAVSKGADRKQVAELTKPQIISKYSS